MKAGAYDDLQLMCRITMTSSPELGSLKEGDSALHQAALHVESLMKIIHPLHTRQGYQRTDETTLVPGANIRIG